MGLDADVLWFHHGDMGYRKRTIPTYAELRSSPQVSEYPMGLESWMPTYFGYIMGYLRSTNGVYGSGSTIDINGSD